MLIINVAENFTNQPGARYRDESEFSGEQFRDELLEPMFLQAIKTGEKLTVDFDGCYGSPSSFLEEAFGGLVRIHKDKKKILSVLIIKSLERPGLAEKITRYINDASIN